jgi:hypothetical protein
MSVDLVIRELASVQDQLIEELGHWLTVESDPVTCQMIRNHLKRAYHLSQEAHKSMVVAEQWIKCWCSKWESIDHYVEVDNERWRRPRRPEL